MRQVTIKGNMGPNERLRLIQQDDGDIIVQVIETDGSSTSVEFAEPHTRHRRTWQTLVRLLDTMAEDITEWQNGEIAGMDMAAPKAPTQRETAKHDLMHDLVAHGYCDTDAIFEGENDELHKLLDAFWRRAQAETGDDEAVESSFEGQVTAGSFDDQLKSFSVEVSSEKPPSKEFSDILGSLMFEMHKPTVRITMEIIG